MPKKLLEDPAKHVSQCTKNYVQGCINSSMQRFSWCRKLMAYDEKDLMENKLYGLHKLEVYITICSFKSQLFLNWQVE